MAAETVTRTPVMGEPPDVLIVNSIWPFDGAREKSWVVMIPVFSETSLRVVVEYPVAETVTLQDPDAKPVNT